MRTGQDAASAAARLREEWKPGICEVSVDVAPLDAPDFLAAGSAIAMEVQGHQFAARSLAWRPQ